VRRFGLRVLAALFLLGALGSAHAQDSYGPVANETLWAVATKVNAGRSTTTAQMAWALYRANPQAFDGSPNKIRTNAVLKVPSAAFVAEIPAAQAYAYATGAGAPPVTLAAAPVQSSITTTALGSTAFAGSAEQATAAGMVSANRSADAVYRYLAPFEDRYAGDVDFDYLLGTAAFDSGRYSQAIFVLQRAVTMRPGFAGARMELARAYYAQGDNESARREFAVLEKENPPPEAQRVIADYQAAIDRRASVYQSQLGGHADLATGYDSNANGAPDIQSFVGITLDSRNQATASSYYSLGIGGLISHPFAPGWRLLGTGSAGYRGNPDASFVDAQSLRLAGGVEWRPGSVELSLQPNFATVMLDGEDNHQVAGIDAAAIWHRDRSQWSLNARAGQTRYADALEVLDVDTLLVGVAVQYRPLALPRAKLLAAATAGADDAAEAGSPYGRDLFGGRLGAIVDFGQGHSLQASIASLSSAYDGPFAVGDRDDDQLGAALGYEWSALRARGWTLGLHLNYVDNRSTVALYDYDRIDAGLSVRKEFR